MRDDKDFLSYKTYVYNFFNSSNFFNFTQVEPAKLELTNFQFLDVISCSVECYILPKFSPSLICQFHISLSTNKDSFVHPLSTIIQNG